MSDRANSISTVAVLGAGTMGQGIAQAAAQAGYTVLLYDVQLAWAKRGVEAIGSTLGKSVRAGRMAQAAADLTLGRITAVETLEYAAQAGLIIEAVPEQLDLKRDIFRQLDTLASPAAILTSNTSSLSIHAIASATQRRERVLGLHFFNPAQVMKLVEVVRTDFVSDSVLETALDFVRRLDKQPVVCADTPGFVVNRIARPYYGEALRLLGEGVAPVSVIDALMETAGFKMGPFKLIDLIGVDVNLAVTESTYQAFFHDPKFRPHPLQARMMQSGRLGRKTGRGFYDYPEQGT